MLLDTLLNDVVPFALLWISHSWQLVSSLVWSGDPHDQQDRLEPAVRAAPSEHDLSWAERRLAHLLAAGHTEPGDVGRVEPPAWLDAARLARARQLHQLYWPAINHAQVLSLFLSFTFADSVRPLAWTGRSHTARLARRRYLQTALFTHSWALGDIWQPKDVACQNAERVRAQHASVARRLLGRDLSQVTLPHGAPSPREPSRLPALQADNVLTLPAPAGCPVLNGSAGQVSCGGVFRPAGYGAEARPLSQRGMVDTQWFFIGLLLLHPDKFGLAHLSDYDLGCLVHLWRSIGHRLGVDERYNLCSGSVTQVRELCRLIEQRILVPQLVAPDSLWHTMTQALYDGLALTFAQCRYDAWLYYLVSDVLGLPSDHLYSTLSWVGAWKHRLLQLLYNKANYSRKIHAAIRARAKHEFQTAATQEKLEPHLTYVFELI